jgi:hypothetical protein
MKLILIERRSDGCTYSVNNFHPIEYSSEEALLLDLEEAMNRAIAENKCSYKFGTIELEVYPEYQYNGPQIKELPEILTLEKWFADNNICPE